MTLLTVYFRSLGKANFIDIFSTFLILKATLSLLLKSTSREKRIFKNNHVAILKKYHISLRSLGLKIQLDGNNYFRILFLWLLSGFVDLSSNGLSAGATLSGWGAVFVISRYLAAVFTSYLSDASSSPPEMSSDISSYPVSMVTRRISSYQLRWMVTGSPGGVQRCSLLSGHPPVRRTIQLIPDP